MTSVFTLKIQIITGILSILISLALYIWYHIYLTSESRKAEKEHLENPDGYGYAFRRKMEYLDELTFIKWLDKSFLKITAFFVSLLMALGSVFVIGFTFASIHTHRLEESINYQETIVKKEALENVMNETEDIINTDLYNQVIGFNTRLAETQAQSIHPNYSINFTGDYDWFEIEPIKINK